MHQSILIEFHRVLALAAAAACLGVAHAEAVTLSNDQVIASWKVEHDQLQPDFVQDRQTGQIVQLRGELFSLVLTNGDFVNASNFKLAGPVRTETLAANPRNSRFAERLPGRQLMAELVSADGNLRVAWRAILREGSRYVRQQVELQAAQASIPLKDIVLLETPLPNA